MSPIVAHEIRQYFKANQAAGGAGEGSAPHLLAHGVLAAAVAAAGGQEVVTAATAAMGAEVAAPLLAQYLYGKTPQTLSADEKTTISAITGLVGAGVGTLSGSDASLVQATQSAMTAVDENQFSGVGNLFGANKWGPAVGSLVNHRTQTSDVLDLDQLADDLAALRRGDGFDNGVSDGILLMAAAPIVIGGGAAVVSVVGGTAAIGAYTVAAGKSVGNGVRTSIFLDEDYKLSNLIYDASIGVVINTLVEQLIKASKAKSLSKRYLEAKGELANFSFGSGVSSAVSNQLQDKDLILVPKTDWHRYLKGRSQ